MRELFAYYRARSSDAAAVQAAVFMFQAELLTRYPLLRARLLRRPEETDGEQTWMESYAMESVSTDPHQAPAGISEEVQAEIERSAAVMAPWIRGIRHLEVFLNCTEKSN